MASLVLGAAGAAVGSFFGPLGTSIGWAVGAGLGNALFPGKGQDGPRLSDLKVHNSSYGQMIPIIYGTVRIAGCVIWSTDWVEHEHHSGGKGGPEETSYTYTISFAVGICEGPILGVLRIWADSRLVWDPDTMDADDFPFTLYLGDATQLPDPTIEAAEGAGNVSGHRGMAYAVFTDLDGSQYNNHVPSFTFEVYTSGGGIPWQYSEFTPVNNQAIGGFNGQGPMNGALENGELLMSHWDAGVNPILTMWRYDLQGNLIEALTPLVCPGITPFTTGTVTVIRPCSNNPHIAYGAVAADGLVHNGGWYYDDAITTQGYNHYQSNCYCIYSDNAVFAVGGGSAVSTTLTKWNAPGGAVNALIASYSLPPSAAGIQAWQLAADDLGNIWAVFERQIIPPSPTLIKFDSDLNVLHTWEQSELPGTFLAGSMAYTIWNGILYYSKIGVVAEAYYINDDYTFTLTDPGDITSVGIFKGNSISLGTGLVLTGNGIVSLQARPQAVTLASIVSDVSVRAGLTTDQVDVEQLTDLVDGYVIANQMAARSAVEPLQVAWPFDAVEHDVVVRFPRRGVNGIIATIDDDDLGAFVPPGDPPALLTTQRLQEVDLPRIVDTTFINLDTDYQNGEARAQRLITTSELTTSLQLPIVMSSQKGLSVCNEQLYNAWIERERFSLSLSRKWLLLEPADVINANGRTMRISKKVEQADGVIKVDALATSLAVYTHLAPPVEGVGMPGGGGTPPTAPPVIQGTDALILDLPLVTDIDNPVGFYAAMAGAVQPSWPGGVLYKSVDGGASFNSLLLNTISDTFGDCSTTLGDFGGGNIVDELNSLTVVVSAGSGTLSSVTNLALLNGANKAAVGIPGESGLRNMEIIQFRDATLVGTRTYTLTGLLRGRRGSEWVMPLHTTGETFVLLPTSVNVLGDPAELYLTRIYRAVTSGRPVSSGANINFSNYGMAALPYAPCHLGGAIQTNGDFILNWTRRTRIGGLWLPFVDVPLSESIELYGVRIYSDSTYATLLATVAANTETCTYTVADQTADFGSPQSILYWGVVQQGTFNVGTEARAVT